MRWSWLLALAVLALAAGCPKRVPDNVAGNDDAQVDQDASKLEELRTRSQDPNVQCSDWCDMKKASCGISKRTCEISGRHSDREDLARKCVASQEDCAQYTDRCTACSH
ncbi:MAG TPA: hypothetical protein VH208_03060 [Myxococcaceae bacterium]|nr:hypothetical protein [Myxococcaceae bacterium]